MKPWKHEHRAQQCRREIEQREALYVSRPRQDPAACLHSWQLCRAARFVRGALEPELMICRLCGATRRRAASPPRTRRKGARLW